MMMGRSSSANGMREGDPPPPSSVRRRSSAQSMAAAGEGGSTVLRPGPGWRELQDFVLKLYTVRGWESSACAAVDEVNASITKLLATEGAVSLVCRELQSAGSVLVRGTASLREAAGSHTRGLVAADVNKGGADGVWGPIVRQWEVFYRQILPTLQAIFLPLTLKVVAAKSAAGSVGQGRFDIRVVALRAFRDGLLAPILRGSPGLAEAPMPPAAAEIFRVMLRVGDMTETTHTEGGQQVRHAAKQTKLTFLSYRGKGKPKLTRRPSTVHGSVPDGDGPSRSPRAGRGGGGGGGGAPTSKARRSTHRRSKSTSHLVLGGASFNEHSPTTRPADEPVEVAAPPPAQAAAAAAHSPPDRRRGGQSRPTSSGATGRSSVDRPPRPSILSLRKRDSPKGSGGGGGGGGVGGIRGGSPHAGRVQRPARPGRRSADANDLRKGNAR